MLVIVRPVLCLYSTPSRICLTSSRSPKQKHFYRWPYCTRVDYDAQTLSTSGRLYIESILWICRQCCLHPARQDAWIVSFVRRDSSRIWNVRTADEINICKARAPSSNSLASESIFQTSWPRSPAFHGFAKAINGAFRHHDALR